jgi:hypothetical protein
LSLPPGFDKITFDKEFNGRNFLLHDGELLSDLPWPPGDREIRYRYRLPAEHGARAVRRVLDLPTQQAVVVIRGKPQADVTCSLAATAAEQGGTLVYASNGGEFSAGDAIEMQIGALPITFDAYARWGAAALLGALVVAAAVMAFRRRSTPAADQEPDDSGATLRPSPRRADVVPFGGVTPRNMPNPSERRRRRAA